MQPRRGPLRQHALVLARTQADFVDAQHKSPPLSSARRSAPAPGVCHWRQCCLYYNIARLPAQEKILSVRCGGRFFHSWQGGDGCAPQWGVFGLIGRRGNGCVPQRGVFSSWKRKERLRPTFLFLLEEKKKRADLRAKSLASLGCAPKRACGRRPGTKKKRIWSGFRDESCSFFVCALRPDSGFLGAVRTGFTACAAAAESY